MSASMGQPGRPALPLAEASRRLRRRPGRPRRLLGDPARTGLGGKGAALEDALDGGAQADRAPTLPLQRWGFALPLQAAAEYTGLPVRRLWDYIGEGVLDPVRPPGCRRVLLLREDLERLLRAWQRLGARPSVVSREHR